MTKKNYPTLVFNEKPVHQVALHKHLGMCLDCKLNFEEHLKTTINKIIKTIGLLRKLKNFLPRKSLLTIYKSFRNAKNEQNTHSTHREKKTTTERLS